MAVLICGQSTGQRRNVTPVEKSQRKKSARRAAEFSYVNNIRTLATNKSAARA
jgi:hypothetical protein